MEGFSAEVFRKVIFVFCLRRFSLPVQSSGQSYRILLLGSLTRQEQWNRVRSRIRRRLWFQDCNRQKVFWKFVFCFEWCFEAYHLIIKSGNLVVKILIFHFSYSCCCWFCFAFSSNSFIWFTSVGWPILFMFLYNSRYCSLVILLFQ